MSRESSSWLNRMILIGFSAMRGNAWHYRLEDQGEEPNHYDGAIPQDDVLRRLFDFEVVETPLYIRGNGGFSEVEGRKAMVTSDDGSVLGIFKSGYQGHSYREWLLDNVGTILDADLGIGSAGLLRNRAQAFVQVEVPESIVTPEGVEFRPNLLACTSFDGSLATTYKRTVTNVVCDNTMDAGLSEDGQTFKVKHSRYSGMKLKDARDALAIIHTMADDFSAEVAELTSRKVNDRQFAALLDLIVPLPANLETASKRSVTVAENKRGELINLYRSDARCAPWTGTAYGVLQTFNTWNHHYASVRKGVPRYLRNMENVVTDKFQTADREILTVLAGIA